MPLQKVVNYTFLPYNENNEYAYAKIEENLQKNNFLNIWKTENVVFYRRL